MDKFDFDLFISSIIIFCLLSPCFSELLKYQRYEIVITAYNIIGESPASGPVEVFVGEAGNHQL